MVAKVKCNSLIEKKCNKQNKICNPASGRCVNLDYIYKKKLTKNSKRYLEKCLKIDDKNHVVQKKKLYVNLKVNIVIVKQDNVNHMLINR